MKKQDKSKSTNDSTRTICPQCKFNLQRTDIKSHIKSCGKYVPTYLNNVRRFMDQISPTYAEFLIAEMDLIKDELQAGIVKSSVQSASKSFLKSEDDDKTKGSSVSKSVRKSEEKQKSNGTPASKLTKRVEQLLKSNGYSPSKSDIKLDKIEKIQMNKAIENSKKVQKISQIFEEPVPAPKSDPKISKPVIEHTIQLQDLFDYAQPAFKPPQSQVIVCADPTCSHPVSVEDIENFTYLDQCLHTICKYCFRNYIRNNYVKNSGQLVCPNKKCKSPIPLMQMQQIMDPSVFMKLQNELNSKLISALVECQKCHQHYHFEKGRPSDAPKSTQEGKPLTPSSAKHYAQNRFQCAKCKSDQCKTCKTLPYHLGFNCAEYQEDKQKKKCRYCRQVLPKGYMSETGIKTFDDICQASACQAQMKEACSKRLPCGHACGGIIKQKTCLPCLKESCAKANSQNLLGQDENSYCTLCYIETLNEAPCIRSKCGHIFHFKCLKKRLDLKWSTPRINFKFCQCPLCNSWIQLPPECELMKTLEKLKALHKSIEQKALKRLSHQGLEKDKKITDLHSEYYNKPSKYAQAIYAYFQCYQCHQPYFGGRKNCADAMNQGSQDKKFNPKEVICPSCCPVQASDCKKHGKEFISFKCRFCCSVAQWFCWGNTHFCDNCHKKQISGEYVSRIPKDKLDKCEGKGKCPVGGEHGGNGEQYCLGCGVCRGDRMDAQDF